MNKLLMMLFLSQCHHGYNPEYENLSEEEKKEKVFCDLELIKKFLGNKLPEKFYNAKKFFVKNLWSKETWAQTEGIFEIDGICGCGNVTLKICIEE